MTARRLILAVMAALSVFVGAFGLTSTPAMAAEGHVFLSSFGSFAYPTSVAVDESTGDVYVLDAEADTVSRYTANGEPAPFSTLGSNELTGFAFVKSNVNQVAVDNSNKPTKGDVYVTNPAGNAGAGQRAVDIFAPDGSSLGALTSELVPCGVAVDPAGNLYISKLTEGVDRYKPTTNPITAEDFDARLSGAALGRNCNVAADSQESVYVGAAFEGQVQKFDAMQFGFPAASGIPIAVTARSFAVDPSTDDFYLDLGGKLVEYDSAGEVLGEFSSEQFSDSTAVGINGANGNVYVADRASKQVYRYTELVSLADVTLGAPSALTETSATLHASVNPLGLSTTCKVEFGTSTAFGSEASCSPSNVGADSVPLAVTADLGGLTPDTVYYYRFVLTNPNGPERVGGQFVSGSKPSIDSQGVVGVGISEATLKARINPNHFETGFHIEYGLDTSYGSVAPASDSKLGTGSADQAVVWSLAGLAPATTYHFRFVATDGFGSVYGPDLVFTTYEDKSTAPGSCANAALRKSQGSSYLPDCRAYELVSPPNKGSASISTDPTKDQASVDGNAIKYASPIAFGDVQGTEVPGAEYISRRGVDGWSVQSINPVQKAPGSQEQTSRYAYVTPDLTAGVFYALSPIGVVPSNVARTPNLYLRNDLLSGGAGSYTLLSDSVAQVPHIEPGFGDPAIAFAGGSDDLTHVVFESSYNLTPDASGLGTEAPKVYEWEGGVERLVGVLPDGKPVSSVIGRGAGGSNNLEFGEPHETEEAISRDGSHIVFTAPPFVVGHRGIGGNIYSRIDHTTSVQLNTSERSEPDPNGAQTAFFWAATPSGSKVFFTTSQALTDNASVGVGEQLYMYDFDAPEGKNLTLISVDSEPSDDHSGQNFESAAVGISEDGSYVYFVGGNDLVPGLPETHNALLYVWHDGQLRGTPIPVGAAWGEGSVNREYGIGSDSFRVTADGRRAAFVSRDIGTARLVGASNVPAGESECLNASGPSCNEVYMYDYDTDKLVCGSCQPAGDASSGNSVFAQWRDIPFLDHLTSYQDRVMSEDGRYLFFDSKDKLVPRATNGRWNVYEYDSVTDEVHMISSGTCGCDSLFVDASSDGKNIFFTTRQHLVHTDIDDNADLYDARVEGGIASQNEPLVSPCTGESCQLPAASPPVLSVPASATFSGVGSLAHGLPAKATTKKVKPKHKTKSKRKAHKRRGKTGKGHAKKRAAVHASHRTGR